MKYFEVFKAGNYPQGKFTKESDVSNRKNEKTTINYLKREGSKFHVTRGKE